MVKKEKKQVYLRWGILAVIILLVSLLQNTGGLLPRIYSVSAMPLIPLVVCIAMLEREMAGACFGMFAGMLWDAVGTRGDGFHAVVLLIIGCRKNISRLFILNLVVTLLSILLWDILSNQPFIIFSYKLEAILQRTHIFYFSFNRINDECIFYLANNRCFL